MLKHNFYRLEYDGGFGRYIGAASCLSASVVMSIRGLVAPHNAINNAGGNVEFWFTQEGIKEIGVHCYRAMKQDVGRESIRVRKANIMERKIIYEDEYQIAVVL